jgi:hypothetical protein
MIFLRFFLILYLFFLCGKQFLSFPEIRKPLTCGALWSVALRPVPGPLVGWPRPPGAKQRPCSPRVRRAVEAAPRSGQGPKPRALTRSEASSPHAPVPIAWSEAATAFNTSDHACPSAPHHRRRPAVLHRLRTGKRRSAGSSPRPATMPHLSPSSPCRPRRRPSSVDHLPRHRRRRREPSPVNHFPPEGPQSCCYLTVLP